MDGVVDPVQRDARPELPQPRVGVPPREHLQDEIELPPREFAVGVAGPDERKELVDVPAFDAGHRDDHLRQDVERALDGQDRFDVLLRNPAGDDGGGQKIVAVGGVERAPARAADTVTGAPDALDRRRDRGGVCDQDDPVELADVDPQLERAGGDDGPEFPVLQPLLHGQADLPGERAVVGVGELLGSPSLIRRVTFSAVRRLFAKAAWSGSPG